MTVFSMTKEWRYSSGKKDRSQSAVVFAREKVIIPVELSVRAVAAVRSTFWRNRLSVVVIAKEREKQSFAPELPVPLAEAVGRMRSQNLSRLVPLAMGMAAQVGAECPAMSVPAKGLLGAYRVEQRANQKKGA